MNADNAKQKHLDAQRLFQQQKFAEALALLDELDQEFPKEQNIMYARARCLVALWRLDEARPLCAYLKDALGHRRGAELLAHIDSSTAATMSAFNVPSSIPKHTPPVRNRQTGPKKVAAFGAAFAAVGVIAAAFFFYNGYTKNSKVAEAAPQPLPDAPTFSKDVAPIFNENCVVCHRTGEPVPMSLTSYEQARPWAKSIRKMVEARQMPPWHADPAIGEWENDRRLSDRDLTTIVRWVDQGTPRGNPEDAPELPTFTEGWKIGEPDTIFTASAQVLPTELEDEYRYVFVPTGFEKDRWIRAAEVRPGNIDVVHHVIVFTADPGKGRNGLGGSLGGFAPGSPPLIMDKGRGMKIEAGAVLVLQIHYHKEPGKMERDQTTVGIKFADETVKKEIRFGTVGTEKFVIPSRTAYYPVEASSVLDEDVHLEQIIPHMHLRGTDMKVWARFPDGRTQDLLFVPKYDFNWQTFYKVAKPIALPKGTELHAYAHFDNSPANPFNPNPNTDVRWGEPTTAEMMYAFYMYTVDNEKLKVKDPGAS
jgi:hypothetical protein